MLARNTSETTRRISPRWLLAAAVSGTLAVLMCAGGIAAVAVVATLSPTLRNFPRHQASPAELPEVEPQLKTEGHGGP